VFIYIDMLHHQPTLNDWICSHNEEFQRAFHSSDVDGLLRIVGDERGTPRKFLLHSACVAQKSQVAIALIDKGGFDIDSKSSSGYTALLWTAIRGDVETCSALLENGADVNTQDESGFSPLAWAASNGHAEIVTLLLSQNAIVDSRTVCENTPLGWGTLL